MSDYKPAVGDRVRVALEGDVTRTGPMTWAFDHVVTFYYDSPYVVSVEKVAPPLPTTPGSVVRTAAGNHYLLHEDGRWYGRAGVPALDISHGSYPFELVHDAGADK